MITALYSLSLSLSLGSLPSLSLSFFSRWVRFHHSLFRCIRFHLCFLRWVRFHHSLSSLIPATVDLLAPAVQVFHTHQLHFQVIESDGQPVSFTGYVDTVIMSSANPQDP